MILPLFQYTNKKAHNNWIRCYYGLSFIHLFYNLTYPQMDFHSVIIHYNPGCQLSNHDSVRNIHILSTLDIFPVGIQSVFYLCISSGHCFQFPLPLLYRIHLLAVGCHFQIIVVVADHTLLLILMQCEYSFLYSDNLLLHQIQFCILCLLQ